MSKDLEQRALVSVLSSPLADVLPYLRSSYYADLFPITRVQADWISKYVDKVGDLPSLREFKRAHPKALPKRPSTPEPLIVLMEELREDLTRDVAQQAAEDMNDAFVKGDMDVFAQLGEEMTDKLTLINAPIDAQVLDTDDHTDQVLADLAAGRGVGNVVPSGFAPLDRELGGGFSGGHLYTLSALVHLGKTYFTTQAATHARKEGFKALYISLEMPSADISEMSLCLRYKLNVNEYIKKDQPADSIKNGETREKWLTRIFNQRKELEKLDKAAGKMFVQGNEMGLNCAKNIMALAKEKEVDIIYIDAAQDIQANKPLRERTANLYMALAELNAVAVKLGIPIVMTVQLSAEVEKKGLVNNLANIQWGQVFAQKSHAVISMVGDRTSDVRDCTIDKNRAGMCGAKFELHMRFPEVSVYATDLQAIGIVLSEDEVFEDADDIDMIKNLHAAASAPQATVTMPTTSTPRKTGRALGKPAQTTEESEYQKKQAERASLRAKRKLRRNKDAN